MLNFYIALVLVPAPLLSVLALSVLQSQDTEVRKRYSQAILFISSAVVYFAMIYLSLVLAPEGELFTLPDQNSLLTVSFIGAFLMGCVISFIYRFSHKIIYVICSTVVTGLSVLLYEAFLLLIKSLELHPVSGHHFLLLLPVFWIALFAASLYVFLMVSKEE